MADRLLWPICSTWVHYECVSLSHCRAVAPLLANEARHVFAPSRSSCQLHCHTPPATGSCAGCSFARRSLSSWVSMAASPCERATKYPAVNPACSRRARSDCSLHWRVCLRRQRSSGRVMKDSLWSVRRTVVAGARSGAMRSRNQFELHGERRWVDPRHTVQNLTPGRTVMDAVAEAKGFAAGAAAAAAPPPKT